MTVNAKKGISFTIETMDDLAQLVATLIQEKTGNILGEKQLPMIKNRLSKRFLDLNLQTAYEYYYYLQDNSQSEEEFLVGLLTTHHTYFFRENKHFDFLKKYLDQIVNRVKERGENIIRIYSAACSRGHEAYSLALFFKHHLKQYPGIDFKIHATDIDPKSIDYARNGVYPYKEIINIPMVYLADHFQRGRDHLIDFVRIDSKIKNHCDFSVQNLLDPHEYPKEKFDIVFCRNVFIYMEREDIKDICDCIKDVLRPSGLLITGLSESIGDLFEEITNLGDHVYRFSRADEQEQNLVNKDLLNTDSNSSVTLLESTHVKNVLIVDDSPSVIKILSKIIEAQGNYKVVGTASNGQEAHEFLAHNHVDIMTLDIHMPLMNGVEYLKQYFSSAHPPVLIISSASRDDQYYAQQALRLGASDFVEKPSLSNFSKSSEEIVSKLENLKDSSSIGSSSVDNSEYSPVKSENGKDCCQIICLDIYQEQKLNEVLKNRSHYQFTTIVVALSYDAYELLKRNLRISTILSEGDTVSNNTIGLVKNLETAFLLCESNGLKKISVNLISLPSGLTIKTLQQKSRANKRSLQILLDEDLKDKNIELTSFANEVFPITSFAHMSWEFFQKSLPVQSQSLSTVSLHQNTPLRLDIQIGAGIFFFDQPYRSQDFLLIRDSDEITAFKSSISISNSLETNGLEYFTNFPPYKYFGDEQLYKKILKSLSANINPQFCKRLVFSKQATFLWYYPQQKRIRIPRTQIIDPLESSLAGLGRDSDDSTNLTALYKKKKVLIIDDSPSIQKILKNIINSSPLLEVHAVASTPAEAIKMITHTPPDLITLDIHLPEMNGIELLKNYLKKACVPVVIISSVNQCESEYILDAMSNGAVDFIEKPQLNNIDSYRKEVLSILESVAQKKSTDFSQTMPLKANLQFQDDHGIIFIGSSTGGTKALQTVLTQLPNRIPPILIAQHIPETFSAALASRLNALVPFNVKEAEHLEVIVPNHVYIAPGGCQMEVIKSHGQHKIKISTDQSLNRFSPSVDVLFNSATHLKDVQKVAIILTGMGKDGAQGMLNLKHHGAITIAQDRKSSIVFGMPKEAIACGAVEYIESLNNIPERLITSYNSKKSL